MRETEKSNKRRVKDPEFWNNVLRGRVIDIGCGDDPLKVGTFGITSVRTFDRQDGDANVITRHIRERFDCVYASQCLEHLMNPPGCLLMFWSLVEPGGHLVITVPEKTLYERGHWPSISNTDHKWAFILDHRSETDAAPPAIRLRPLAESLPGGSVLRCEVIDTNYSYDPKMADTDQTLGSAEAWLELVVRKDQ